jgi:hypothetical protein
MKKGLGVTIRVIPPWAAKNLGSLRELVLIED